MLGLFVLREKMRGPRTAFAYSSVANGSAANDGRNIYGMDQKASPTAMLLTGGIVALVGLGLLSMNADYIIEPKEPVIVEVTNIPIAPPPPDQKRVVEKNPPIADIFIPKPPVNIPVTHENPIDSAGDEPSKGFDPDVGGGTMSGTGDEIVEPTKPIDLIIDPIFVKVRPDPRYIAKFQPDYPSAMQREQLEGTVSVKVLVGTDGRVKQVQILSATDPAFAAATEKQALKSWRFKPATKDGAPYEEWYTTRVIFKLDR